MQLSGRKIRLSCTEGILRRASGAMGKIKMRQCIWCNEGRKMKQRCKRKKRRQRCNEGRKMRKMTYNEDEREKISGKNEGGKFK